LGRGGAAVAEQEIENLLIEIIERDGHYGNVAPFCRFDNPSAYDS